MFASLISILNMLSMAFWPNYPTYTQQQFSLLFLAFVNVPCVTASLFDPKFRLDFATQPSDHRRDSVIKGSIGPDQLVAWAGMRCCIPSSQWVHFTVW